ncbi:renin receptor isoform X1 [Centruroides vittatus]|uniref:renin receptor isoform X1 n=1 Tax=Centruroides vittatus TaxID=120091 RepID=UPI00350FF0D8
MFRVCLLILAGFICYSSGKEELIILHSPSSVKFSGNEPIRSSVISDLFSASISFTLPKEDQWPDLEPVNPFHRPEALFIMQIIGFDNNLDLNLDGNHFLLENMGDVDAQYNILKYRTNNRYTSKPVLVQFEADENLHSSISEYPLLLKDLPPNKEKRLKWIKSDTELNQGLKDETFNISVPNDMQLLRELATVKALVNCISKHKSLIVDGVPDIYWVKLSGLQNLIEEHGIDSYQVSEAVRLLRQTILEIIPVLKSAYNNLIMIAGITENSESHTLLKRTRNLLAADLMSLESKELNLAEVWSPDFPVAFSIISFLAIVMILAVLGISVAIWNMDPGRDSIMIGQRTKKD